MLYALVSLPLITLINLNCKLFAISFNFFAEPYFKSRISLNRTVAGQIVGPDTQLKGTG